LLALVDASENVVFSEVVAQFLSRNVAAGVAVNALEGICGSEIGN